VRTLATMSRIRGLSSVQPVPSVTLPRSALLEQVKEHIQREVPPSAIQAEGLVQKLLGFFPVDEDYEAATYALLEGQLAGYYEPENGTMYLAGDLDLANARSTLAHELVHALQDQHWDLRTRSRYVAGQDDKDSAFSALAEGDATSAMEDETLARERPGATALDVSDADFARVLRESVASGVAPHALRMSLVAPYVDGVAFVNGLRRQGGWASVDAAWEHPPETTEQILHPEKWRAHEPAIVLPPPPPPAGDLTIAMANTYGEEGLRLAFEEWMPEVEAGLAASGWGGDRAGLYGRGEAEHALLWHVRFDEATGGDAGAFAARAFRAVSLALPKLGRLERSEEGAACVAREGNGVMGVVRDGRDVVLAFGTVSVSGAGWRASMSCGEAVAWAKAALGGSQIIR
jgi:hypothetical protein